MGQWAVWVISRASTLAPFALIFFFWLRWVLVAARGIFVEAWGIFLLQCTGSSLRHAGFSLVVACGFSLSSCGAQAPGHVGSVVCGTQALSLSCVSSVVVAHGLSCPAACGVLVPWPGIEPASPALEGGFFTTGPPGKSHPFCFKGFIPQIRKSRQRFWYLLNISLPISTLRNWVINYRVDLWMHFTLCNGLGLEVLLSLGFLNSPL